MVQWPGVQYADSAAAFLLLPDSDSDSDSNFNKAKTHTTTTQNEGVGGGWVGGLCFSWRDGGGLEATILGVWSIKDQRYRHEPAHIALCKLLIAHPAFYASDCI